MMPVKAKKNNRPWGKRRGVFSKMENRPRSKAEYHTYRWTKESRAYREQNPLCELCKRNGFIVPAEVVDHIVPVAICIDFWDKLNWQSLCRKCNIEKGNQDKKIINGR